MEVGLIGGQGFLGTARLLTSQTFPDIGMAKPRVDFQGAVVIGDGLVVFSQVGVKIAPAVKGRGIVGVDFQTAVIFRNCLLELGLGTVDGPPVEVCPRDTGDRLPGPGYSRPGLYPAALYPQRHRRDVCRPGHSWD